MLIHNTTNITFNNWNKPMIRRISILFMVCALALSMNAQTLEVTGSRLVPDWLESDKENLRGTVKELPKREAIDVPVNEMLIVELYSK